MNLARRITNIVLSTCIGINVFAEEIDSVNIKEVVVTGTRTITSSADIPNTVTSITSEQLEQSIDPSILTSASMHTPGLFVTSRNVVGYGISTGAAGSMSVRGIGGDGRVLVLIDGQPQYAGLYGHSIPDMYSTYMAESVEVIRGPSSVLYGSNALGGVINIIRQKVATQRHFKSCLCLGSYGTLTANTSMNDNKEKSSLCAAVGYVRSDGHRSSSAFSNLNGFVKYDYKISKTWKWSADATLNHIKSENPGPTTAPLHEADAKVMRGLVSVSLTNLSEKSDGLVRAYYDFGHHNIRDGYTETPSAPYPYKHDDFLMGISAYQNLHLMAGNNITLGIDAQRFGGKAWTGELIYANRSETECAAYTDLRQTIHSNVTLDAGMRMNYHSVCGTEWVPQVGMTYHVTKSQTAKLIVSKGFRNPTIKERYMFTPANPNLLPERLVNYEASYAIRKQNWVIDVNAFYLDAENLINKVYNSAVSHVVLENTHQLHNWGLELSGRCNLSPLLPHLSLIDTSLMLSANYSYLHTNKPVACAPTHKALVSLEYKHKRLSSALTVQYIGGLSLENNNDTDKQNYTLLGVNVSYDVMRDVNVFVKGENLLSKRYQTYTGYPMPGALFLAGVSVRY